MPNKNKDGEGKRFVKLEEMLRSRLVELQRHVSKLRTEIAVEDEVDDEATQAFRSSSKDLLMITMEREIKNISEIELALERLNKNQYGVCAGCEETIPYIRLCAIPWTRLCVDCAGGGAKTQRLRGALITSAALGT